MGRASRRKRERPPLRVLYHYTATGHLASILAEGRLRLTDSQVDGRPAVWFLDTPTTEGRDHGLSGSVWDKTEVRVTVRARAVRWLDWVATLPPSTRAAVGGTLGRWIPTIVRTGGGPEAAAHWWVAFEPVTIRPHDVAVRDEAGEYVPLPRPKYVA